MRAKKKKEGKVVEGDRNFKFLIGGIVMGIFLIAYVLIVISTLSKSAGSIFSGFFNFSDSGLEYDLEAFERVFPGELESIEADLNFYDPVFVAPISPTGTTTLTTSTTSTNNTTSTEDTTSTDSLEEIIEDDPEEGTAVDGEDGAV